MHALSAGLSVGNQLSPMHASLHLDRSSDGSRPDPCATNTCPQHSAPDTDPSAVRLCEALAACNTCTAPLLERAIAEAIRVLWGNASAEMID